MADTQPRVITGKRAAWVAIAMTVLPVFEGYAPVAVHEKADPPGVITWCFGRTNYDDPTVPVGERFTKAQCEQLLADDLPKYAIGVRKCVPGFDEMPPSRQASLVSFTYNLGAGTLCKSGVAKDLNAGNVQAGCDAMLAYVNAAGKYLCGLDKRRQDERAMCLGLSLPQHVTCRKE